MTTRADIKNLMAYMGMAFPNYKPVLEGEVNTVDVLFNLLGDIDLPALKTAVQACCAEPGRAFAPSAGEIRGMVTEFHAQASGLPTAGEAWGAIIASFERMPGGNMAGGGRGPILDNPVVKEAVHQMGGYAAIGVDFFETQMANRAHFLKIYGELCERTKRQQGRLPVVNDYIKQLEDRPEIKQLADRLHQ